MRPPETESVWPVMKPASSEARKTTAGAMSSGTPSRPHGITRLRLSASLGLFSANSFRKSGVVEHRHPRALAGEGLRDGAADAAGPAGDDGGAAGEPHRTIDLAMMSFMISEVPPPMVMSRASRAKRSTGYSRM